MPLANSEFLTLFAPLIKGLADDELTELEFVAAAIETFDSWIIGGARASSIATQTAALIQFENRLSQAVSNWYAGTAVGGPNSDGMYPLPNSDGVEFLVPSPAKLVTIIAKGDPGRDPRTGFTFSTQHAFGPSERFWIYDTMEYQEYVPELCRARALTSATAVAVITIKKNEVDWGTITFAPGATFGVFVIPTPIQDVGEYLTFHAPLVPDATLGNVAFTIVGESNP